MNDFGISLNFKDISESIDFEDLANVQIDFEAGGIADPLGQIANWIVQTVGSYISSAITSIGQGVNSIVSGIVSVTNGLVNNAINTLSGMYSLIKSLPDTVTGVLNSLSGSIKTIVSGITSQVAASLSGLGATLSSGINSITATMNSSFSGLSKSISSISSTITSSITSSLGGIVSSITSIVGNITSAISALPSQITASVSSALNIVGATIVRTVQGISSGLNDIGKQIGSTVASGLSQAIQNISALGAQISASVVSALQGAFKVVSDTLSGLSASMVKAIQGTIDYLKELNIGKVITDGLAWVGSQFKIQFDNFVNSLKLPDLSKVIDFVIAFGKDPLGTFRKIIDNALIGLGFPTLEDIGKKITSGFDSFGPQIKTQLDNFVSSLKLPDLSKVIDFATAFGKDPLGTFGKIIDSALKTFGFPTLTDIRNSLDKTWTDFKTWLSDFKLPDFSKVLDFITAFGKDPLGAFGKIVDDTLTSFGLPTLEDIGKAITDKITGFFSPENVKDVFGGLFALPAEIMNFFKSAMTVIDRLTEQHSPSILDNIGSFFGMDWKGFMAGLNSFFNPTPKQRQAALQAQGVQFNEQGQPIGNVDIVKGLEDWFMGIGKTVFNSLKDFGTQISKGLTDLGNWIVDGLISTFKMPAPAQGITDPFGKLFNSITQSLVGLAKVSTSSTPITDKTIQNVIEGIAFTLVASEAVQWTGLAIDAAHPIKNLQLKDKLKDFISSIGLGNVTGILGSTLVAASLSPIMQRFWNKQSQVRLVGPSELLEMWHRDVFGESVCDEYLSEHGYDANFRKGLKENYWKVPSLDNIAEAYLRFMTDNKISRAQVEKELAAYLDVFDLRPLARKGMTFSERDLVGRMLYRGISRYERRSLNAVGFLTDQMATNILTIDRAAPDIVPQLVKAERLQGSQAYRNRIQSEITERVTKGYQVIKDFSDMLTKYEYAPSQIDYLTTANQLAIQTAIDEARLKETELSYTQGIIDKPEYERVVHDVIKNDSIAVERIKTADITRNRNDETRVRDEGNMAVSYELAAFAQGGVTTKDFEALASAMGKNDKEIERLETARAILLDNKIRAVKFATLQYLLGKRQITRDQFIAHSAKIKIDPDLTAATADKTVAQALAKAKTTPAKADESIFARDYPSVI